MPSPGMRNVSVMSDWAEIERVRQSAFQQEQADLGRQRERLELDRMRQELLHQKNLLDQQKTGKGGAPVVIQ